MKILTEFLERNKPVFIIGLITIGTFLLIIFLATKNPINGPDLKTVGTDIELINENTNTRGNKSSKVILVEFSDFQCPACAVASTVVDQLSDKYGDKMLIAYKHFPLPGHPDSFIAAKAAQAAGKQGKFWEYGSILFQNQTTLTEENFVKYAESLGLDIEKFKSDYNSAEIANEVNIDKSIGLRLNLRGTPTFILNNEILEFSSYSELDLLVNKAITEAYGQTDTSETQIAEQNDIQLASLNTNQLQNTQNQGEDVKKNDQSVINGDLIISYTKFGFSPDKQTVGLNSKLTFVNKSEEPMTLQQVTRTYSALTQPMLLGPDESFSIEMTLPGVWNFKEANSTNYGSIVVQ